MIKFRLYTVAIILTIGIMSSAQAWEMRVCAPPDDYPVSSQSEPGYQNRIAEILADELGAELTYEWLILNRQTVSYEMNAGACDVAMGVADGAGGLISTLVYHQTPYVMVFPTDGPQLTGALDDPLLEGLRLATYPNSLSDNALRQYGHGDQLVHIEPRPRNLAHDYTEPTLEALLEGRIDAALLEGARAGHFVHTHPELSMQPVSPLIVGPLMQLYRNSTIAVRAGDESLRDQLNIALAARWNEIQDILAEFGVPTMANQAPALPAFPAPDAVIGLVLPTPSQIPAETDRAAQAARDGARLGDDLSARDSELTVHLRQASAPSAAAAARAAARLVELDGAAILVGGIGADQATSIAETAESLDRPFLSLDAAAVPAGGTSLSVSPTGTDYLQALLGHVPPQQWFIISDATVHPAAEAIIEAADGTVAGEHVISGTTLIYFDVLADIPATDATAILLLTANAEQEQFLTQAQMLLPDMPVYAVTDIVGQSREFLLRWRTAAPDLGEQPRVTAWEPTDPLAEDLNSRFMGRTGRTFDPAAWAGFAALAIAHDALSADRQNPLEYLASGAHFDVGKQGTAWFDPESRILQQDLYLVNIDPDVSWSLSVQDQLDLGRLIERLPAER